MVCFTRAVVTIGLLSVLGCGTTLRPIEPVETQKVQFICDPVINSGKNLEIDIIYITYVQELREVMRLGPKQWFETEKRAQWKFKESVTLQGGDNAVVTLDPVVLKRTVLLVVFANYSGVLDPANQQVVIDYAGQESELIRVEKSRILPQNESLRYVK